MLADKKSNDKWYGNGDINADQKGKASDGLATEAAGRDVRPDMYENDTDDSIWKRGGLKRIRHSED